MDLVKTAGDQKLPSVTGLDFLSDGRVVAVEHYNRKCIVLSSTLARLVSGYQFQTNPLLTKTTWR